MVSMVVFAVFNEKARFASRLEVTACELHVSEALLKPLRMPKIRINAKFGTNRRMRMSLRLESSPREIYPVVGNKEPLPPA